METTQQAPSAAMPDAFDYAFAQLKDLPDVIQTKESIVRQMPFMGVGGSDLFVITTMRQKDRGETIFLEHVSKAGTVRLVLPPDVSAVILRQHEALNSKSRRRGAQAAVQTRKERGIEPAFLKGRKRKAAR
jgi:hypothetical protein